VGRIHWRSQREPEGPRPPANEKNLKFVVTRFVFFQAQNALKFARTPLGELTMLPRPSSWLGRGIPHFILLSPLPKTGAEGRGGYGRKGIGKGGEGGLAS